VTSHVWFAAQPHWGTTPHALLGGAVTHEPPEELLVEPPEDDVLLVDPPEDDDVLLVEPPDDEEVDEVLLVDPPEDEVDEVDDVLPPELLVMDPDEDEVDDVDELLDDSSGSVGATPSPTAVDAPLAHARSPTSPTTRAKRSKRNIGAVLYHARARRRGRAPSVTLARRPGFPGFSAHWQATMGATGANGLPPGGRTVSMSTIAASRMDLIWSYV
jgi:hypothetical protein